MGSGRAHFQGGRATNTPHNTPRWQMHGSVWEGFIGRRFGPSFKTGFGNSEKGWIFNARGGAANGCFLLPNLVRAIVSHGTHIVHRQSTNIKRHSFCCLEASDLLRLATRGHLGPSGPKVPQKRQRTMQFNNGATTTAATTTGVRQKSQTSKKSQQKVNNNIDSNIFKKHLFRQQQTTTFSWQRTTTIRTTFSDFFADFGPTKGNKWTTCSRRRRQV